MSLDRRDFLKTDCPIKQQAEDFQVHEILDFDWQAVDVRQWRVAHPVPVLVF
jgi:hypothetical protein